jgi:anti-anti-sigma factor
MHPAMRVVELAVKGRIDAETGVELEHAVAEELRRGYHAIRLDCTDVSFLSSAGIRVLFNVHRAAKTAGAWCLIGAASEPVARVLELTRLAPMLREPQFQESQLQTVSGHGQPRTEPVGRCGRGRGRQWPRGCLRRQNLFRWPGAARQRRAHGRSRGSVRRRPTRLRCGTTGRDTVATCAASCLRPRARRPRR